ncbi:MAG: methylated-DNA--[protein]-cysteine S-methyltransferase [Pseudomonadota bacterium]
MAQKSVETQFGPLTVTEAEGAIVALDWLWAAQQDSTPLLNHAVAQLSAYATGASTQFDLPLRVAGTRMQQRVCEAMLGIDFGDTVTYGEIARALGISAQSVGQACGHNPIPIIIPCHRVMGVKGLTGFSGVGGVETKVALLRHEGAAGLLI